MGGCLREVTVVVRIAIDCEPKVKQQLFVRPAAPG